MKKYIGTLLSVVCVVICIFIMAMTIHAEVSKGPCSAQDITDGRIENVYAYEQFGDFIDVRRLGPGVPTKNSTCRYVELPYGAATMKNPISAIDEEGNVLFQFSVINKNTILVSVEGARTAYRVITNAP